MTYQEVLNQIKAIRKGAFVRIAYKSNPHTLKAGRGEDIEKVSVGVYRIGIKYANLKINENKVIQPLNGKKWAADDLINYVLESDKNGEKRFYLRVYTTKIKTRSKWSINGLETTKAALVERGLISDTKSSFTPCFDLAIENIISIG